MKRRVALARYLDDGAVPIDNTPVENTIRPWALGRSNWLFVGSLRSGKWAVAIMSLIQSARMNGHDPYAYLKGVLTRLPRQIKHSDATFKLLIKTEHLGLHNVADNRVQIYVERGRLMRPGKCQFIELDIIPNQFHSTILSVKPSLAS